MDNSPNIKLNQDVGGCQMEFLIFKYFLQHGTMINYNKKNSQHTWDNAMEIDEDLEQKLSKY